MSTLRLFRGPGLRMVYRGGPKLTLGTASPESILLVADQTVVMRAHPSDFPALLAWLEGEAAKLKRFMTMPAEERASTRGVMDDAAEEG